MELYKYFGSRGTFRPTPMPHIQSCMVHGFIPTTWRKVKVTIILKPGKFDYTKAKAYCPISLSSLFLKTMAKAADRHIRDGALKILLVSLHRNEYAYQIG